MPLQNNIDCPVDHVKVSENRVRLTAFFVLLLGISFLARGVWWIALFLVVDFFLRAFGVGAYSLLNLLSGWIERGFAFKPRQVDRAPKVFAARLGFVLSGGLLVLALFDVMTAAYLVAGVLVLFSFLESALGFCAGCYVYFLVKKISGSAEI